MARRLMVPVDSVDLDVLVAGWEGARTVATLHPMESMHEALPLLAEVTEAHIVGVNPRASPTPPRTGTSATPPPTWSRR